MDSITQAAHFALSTVLRDEPWQDLGFTKRPQYGSIVQRFRPLWRVQLEKTALKQMIAVFTAAHVHAGSLDEADVPSVVEILLNGPNGTDELWRSYGYTSSTEARDHFTRAIEDYVESESREWASILGGRMGFMDRFFGDAKRSDEPPPKVNAVFDKIRKLLEDEGNVPRVDGRLTTKWRRRADGLCDHELPRGARLI